MKMWRQVFYIILNVILIQCYGKMKDLQNNIVHKTYEAIEELTNRLFSMLRLKQFKHFHDNQYMLNIYYKLRNLYEIDMKIYIMTKEITRQDSEINDLAIILIDVIRQYIIDEYDHKIQNTTILNPNIDFYHNLLKEDSAKEIVRTEKVTVKRNPESIESFIFLKNFANKFKSLSLNDFKKREMNLSKNLTKQLPKRYYDLKPWEPVNYKEHKVVSTRRLFNIRATSILKYPFIVSISIKGNYACPGSIISKTLIITTAHCLQSVYKNRFLPNNLPTVSIRVGSDYTGKLGEVIPVITIFFHPNYDPATLKNNLAILKLNKHNHFKRNKNIRRIALNRKPGNIHGNSNRVTVLGWDAINSQENKIHESKLSYDVLSVFDHENCRKAYIGRQNISKLNFCASTMVNNEGAFKKDIGSPAIANGVLVGLVSSSPSRFDSINLPIVFTKLSCYSYWIQGIIGEDPSRIFQFVKETKSTTVNELLNKGMRISNSSEKNFPFYPEAMKIIKNTLLSESSKIISNIIFGVTNNSVIDRKETNDRLEIKNDNVKVLKYQKKTPTTLKNNIYVANNERTMVINAPRKANKRFTGYVINNPVNYPSDNYEYHSSESDNSYGLTIEAYSE